MFYVYFIESLRNIKVYVGFTEKKPEERTREHNTGSNRWSKQNGPFRLIYYEIYHCKEDAFSREQFFKTGVGKKVKKAIIEVMRA